MKSGFFFENPKRKCSWVIPVEPSTSIARPNHCGKKGMIYYELLQPGQTINTEGYRQQMIDLNQATCGKQLRKTFYLTHCRNKVTRKLQTCISDTIVVRHQARTDSVNSDPRPSKSSEFIV